MRYNISAIDYIIQLIRVRSSCRDFDTSSPVDRSEIDFLLRCVDMGPAAGGLYAYTVSYTTDRREKLKLQKASLDQVQVSNCGVVFCISARASVSINKYGERGTLYAIQDATAAGMNITYAAAALGLDSCWIGSVDADKVRKIFNMTDDETPLSLICIGHRHDTIKKTGNDQQSKE